MYNAYQGGPPPGLTQQHPHPHPHHHHHQHQHQAAHHSHHAHPSPSHSTPPPWNNSGAGSGTPNGGANSGSNVAAHHATFTPGGRAPSGALRPPGPTPNAPRSSAAIPIIRPDGSITASSPKTTGSPLPTARKAASKGLVSSPTPGKANASGLSKTAAGAAIFVPKSGSSAHSGSLGKTDETPISTPANELRSLSLAPPGDPPPQSGPAVFVPSGNSSLHARAVAGGAGSAVFTPANQSGRGTPTGYASGAGSSGYDSEGMANAAFDPTYSGPIPPSHASNSGSYAMAAEPPSTRPYNPYEHMDQQGHGGYEDPSSAQPIVPIRLPLQYHLSAPPLPHTSNLHPQHLAQHAYFMSPSLREDLFRRNEAVNVSAASIVDLGGTQTRPPQPEEVHVYKDLVPLEPDSSGPLPYGSRGNPVTIGAVPTQLLPRHLLPIGANGLISSMGALSSLPISASGGPLAPSSALGGYPTEVHRATCTLDGKTYVLRRIVGFNLGRERERALEGVERWRRLRCPGVVNVREAFTSWRWGEASIVFVYDFHPLSTTLFAEHLLPRPPRVDPRTGRLQAVDMHVPERKMWSYLCQLASALRQVHKLGLAARCIELGKVLLTGKNRVRINCCSILDVLTYDPQNPPSAESTAQHQADDLYKLGILILCLSSLSSTAGNNVAASLDNLDRHYSKELKDVVSWLVQSPREAEREHGASKDADELLRLLGPHLADEVEASENYSDLLEDSLSRELENARLVRLLCKMGFINERPEYDHDPNWSSTGERYLISLFRDYLFHSVEEGSGKPVLDLSHLLSNLNRLDAGSEDRIMLTSRDEQSCLVVSYKEIKAAIDSAFGDLSRHA